MTSLKRSIKSIARSTGVAVSGAAELTEAVATTVEVDVLPQVVEGAVLMVKAGPAFLGGVIGLTKGYFIGTVGEIANLSDEEVIELQANWSPTQAGSAAGRSTVKVLKDLWED